MTTNFMNFWIGKMEKYLAKINTNNIKKYPQNIIIDLLPNFYF